MCQCLWQNGSRRATRIAKSFASACGCPRKVKVAVTDGVSIADAPCLPPFDDAGDFGTIPPVMGGMPFDVPMPAGTSSRSDTVAVETRAAGVPGVAGASRRVIRAAGAPSTSYTRHADGRVSVARSAAGPGDSVQVPSDITWRSWSAERKRAWARSIGQGAGLNSDEIEEMTNLVLAQGPRAAVGYLNARGDGGSGDGGDFVEPRYPTASEWANMDQNERRRWAAQVAREQRMSEAQTQAFVTRVVEAGLEGARGFIREYFLTERERIRANRDVQLARYGSAQAGEQALLQGGSGTTTTNYTGAPGSKGTNPVLPLAAVLVAARFLG